MKTIELTKGFTAVVDDDDYEAVSKHSWCILDLRSSRNGKVYAMSRINKKIVYLHRFIMKPPKGMVVDHHDHDGLNNRRYNLVVCTDQQNKRNKRGLSKHNRSGHNGVFFDKERGKYRAEISIEKGRSKSLGRFDRIEDAIAARKAAEEKYYKPKE
jgi:hypothetical protein